MKIREIIETKINIISSFVFLTNAFVAYLFDYKLYSFLFFMLWITSMIYHTNKNIYTNILDKIVILTIFLYGGYLFVTKPQNTNYKIMIVLSFLSTIFLYYYTSQYEEYELSLQTQTNLHSLLHIIASIGHHLIVI